MYVLSLPLCFVAYCWHIYRIANHSKEVSQTQLAGACGRLKMYSYLSLNLCCVCVCVCVCVCCVLCVCVYVCVNRQTKEDTAWDVVRGVQ